MGSPTQRDFHHPYQPYDIQNDLMNAIYECIEGGKIGIFESPTGTVSYERFSTPKFPASTLSFMAGRLAGLMLYQGKSLSLLCSSLTWLRNFQENMASTQAVALEGKLQRILLRLTLAYTSKTRMNHPGCESMHWTSEREQRLSRRLSSRQD